MSFWLSWIDLGFDMHIRTAQRVMSAATEYGGKSDTVSYLTPKALYELAAPSALVRCPTALWHQRLAEVDVTTTDFKIPKRKMAAVFSILFHVKQIAIRRATCSG
jgi:hypothetical protein